MSHHEHHEGCSCGHDHEHEHHHHHHHHECDDPGCSCHDHHHEHHHEHHHGHECDDPGCSCHEHGHHHHHHESRAFPCCGGAVELRSSVHEGAMVCAAHAEWPGIGREAEEARLTNVMRAVADWVTDSGGFIGHIKATLDCSESSAFSITRDELMKTLSGAATRLELVAIVFGVEGAALEAKMQEAFQTLD